MRCRVVPAAAVVLGAACLNTAEPKGFVFRYSIGAYGCDTTCATPGANSIASAARGDTVWLQHLLELVAAVDSFRPQTTTLRAECSENVAILMGNSAVDTVPTPTCPDSTYQQSFQLKDIDWPAAIVRYTRWVVDSSLTPGLYGLRGRVMVQPRIEPTFGFTIQ
jgi:hypothetical protein